MWYKQLTAYPIPSAKIPDIQKLKDALKEAEFTHSQGLEWYSEGFTAPLQTQPEELAFYVQGSMSATLKKEEKLLPSAVINEVLAEKVNLIEQEEVRSVGRKEKQSLKEQVVDDLLPRAFTKSSKIHIIFDCNNGFLFINQSSSTKAEAALTKLRQCLGGLEAKLLRTKLSPAIVMTDWLVQEQAVGQFILDSDCELKGAGEAAAIVRMSKQDLTADEIKSHLENKQVFQIGLVWANKVSFVLNANLTLKRIRFLDIVQEEASNEGEDKESLYAATQMIMTSTLGQMMNELIEAFGGTE